MVAAGATIARRLLAMAAADVMAVLAGPGLLLAAVDGSPSLRCPSDKLAGAIGVATGTGTISNCTRFRINRLG